MELRRCPALKGDDGRPGAAYRRADLQQRAARAVDQLREASGKGIGHAAVTGLPSREPPLPGLVIPAGEMHLIAARAGLEISEDQVAAILRVRQHIIAARAQRDRVSNSRSRAEIGKIPARPEIEYGNRPGCPRRRYRSRRQDRHRNLHHRENDRIQQIIARTGIDGVEPAAGQDGVITAQRVNRVIAGGFSRCGERTDLIGIFRADDVCQCKQPPTWSAQPHRSPVPPEWRGRRSTPPP